MVTFEIVDVTKINFVLIIKETYVHQRALETKKLLFFPIFIVIQLQLYAFSPLPPAPTPEKITFKQCQAILFHVEYLM